MPRDLPGAREREKSARNDPVGKIKMSFQGQDVEREDGLSGLSARFD